MSRDGSSGGVIRLAVITEQGVQRIFVPGDQVPGTVYSLVVFKSSRYISFGERQFLTSFAMNGPLLLVHWEG